MATVKISQLPAAQQVAWTDVGLKRDGAAGFMAATDGSTGQAFFRSQTFDCGPATASLRFRMAGAGGTFEIGSTSQIQWYSGTTIGAGSQDTSIHRYAAGVVRFGDAGSGIRGLQGGGAAVASATALPLPTGRVFHVTGTTTITSITSTDFAAGAVITLIFDGILTFTDGSNLKLNGNFVTSADDTITLVYDGSNWYEMCRSAN